MAKKGVKHLVAAPVTGQVFGQLPTYGRGMKVGNIIQVDPNPSYNDNPLYASNVIVNEDRSMSDYPITLGVDEFGDGNQATHDTVVAMLTGAKLTTEDGQTFVDYGEAPDSNRVGLGYYVNGNYPKNAQGKEIPYYEAVAFYQVDFAGKPQQTANTKGQSITWGTETITGHVRPVEGVEANMNVERHVRFDNEADAIAFLDAFFGVVDPSVKYTVTITGGTNDDYVSLGDEKLTSGDEVSKNSAVVITIGTEGTTAAVNGEPVSAGDTVVITQNTTIVFTEE